MVSSTHEAMHRIFQKDPALLTRALQQVLGVAFPEPRDFAGMNIDLTEIEPVERRVDTLLRAETDEGPYLLVVEAQRQKDDRKRGSWPYYLTYLHEKYRCEPVLIVTTQCSATARWAAEPGIEGRRHTGIAGNRPENHRRGQCRGLRAVRRLMPGRPPGQAHVEGPDDGDAVLLAAPSGRAGARGGAGPGQGRDDPSHSGMAWHSCA